MTVSTLGVRFFLELFLISAFLGSSFEFQTFNLKSLKIIFVYDVVIACHLLSPVRNAVSG